MRALGTQGPFPMAVAAKAKPAAAKSASAPAPAPRVAASTVGRAHDEPRMEREAPTVRQIKINDGTVHGQTVSVLDGPIRSRGGQNVGLRYTGAEDMFSFDRSIIPPGWDYQWKVQTIKGWQWREHQVQI